MARKEFFNAPFFDEAFKIGWTCWNSQTSKVHSRHIARISRCVVHPDLRGLGIAAVLVQAGIKYAKERWLYGKARAAFLEITADMLNYLPFVHNAGFVKIGETEGNFHRVIKDMTYLVSRATSKSAHYKMPQGGGGIMTLQRSYATKLMKSLERKKVPLSNLLSTLMLTPSPAEAWH